MPNKRIYKEDGKTVALNFGKYIKERRIELNLTQEDLAARCKVTCL